MTQSQYQKMHRCRILRNETPRLHVSNILSIGRPPPAPPAGGATSRYSLAEFKGEQLDQLHDRLEEGYLLGHFGALPFLGDPAKLGWTRSAAE